MIPDKILAEIITIGDEILIGQIVDTNSAWMAVELNKIGVSVKQISSVSDDETHILQAFADAENRTDLIIVTGGLGPTKDDITKKTMFKYFGADGWKRDEATLKVIEKIFAKYNAPLLETNKLQASVPNNCEVLLNDLGTAPGMLFRKNGKICISLPGVPYEMMNLMENTVLPKIVQEFNLPKILHRTILTAGVGESFLADKLADIENELPTHIKLAYLPRMGQVRLRLSSLGNNEKELANELNYFVEKIADTIPDNWIAKEDIPIEKVILDLMEVHKLTLSVAESCTGGSISEMLTQHPGCSAVFAGGGIVYANEMKVKLLGVSNNTLSKFGAVSEETVREMVNGALVNFTTDYAIAVTGIAGPDGGLPDKPVGTVWIAVANPQQTIVQKFIFGNKRQQNIERATINAFNLLYRLLKTNIAV
jgi:nicotinamide-nucleotide amidase